MKNIVRLELEEARLMVNAAVAKSKEIGVLESICVVDEGGFPIVLERMNGARITGPQIAWNKAFTAAGHKRSTHLFTTPPNGPAPQGLLRPGGRAGLWRRASRGSRRACRSRTARRGGPGPAG